MKNLANQTPLELPCRCIYCGIEAFVWEVTRILEKPIACNQPTGHQFVMSELEPLATHSAHPTRQ